MAKNKEEIVESGGGADVIEEPTPDQKSSPTIKTVGESKPKLIEVPSMGASPLTKESIIHRDYTAGAEDLEFEETKEKAASPEAEVAQEPISDKGSTEEYDVEGADGARVDPMEFEEEKEEEAEKEEKAEETGTDPEEHPIPDKTAKEGAKKTAEWIMDMYCSVYPELLYQVTKMDEDEMNIAEDAGEVVGGATGKVTEINDRNRKQLDVDDDSRRMIEKPLVETLIVYKLKLSPPIMLALAAAFVCIMMFITSRSIAKSNERIVAKLIEEGKKRPQPPATITVDATEETPT